MDAVRIRDLAVERGGRAVLHDISLDLPAGRVTGLVGPSGSGKTTLMRCIAGVQVVAGGTVTVLGEPAGTPGNRHRVGYMTQAPSVYLDLSVAENLRYFAAVAGAPRARVAAAAATVGLDREVQRVVRDLSGGEVARVSLAVALLGDPAVLVLDEPTVGLDPVLRQSLWGTFRALAAGGTAVLVSTHVMDEAAECDELVLLRDGAVLARATPDELLAGTGAATLSAAFLTLVRAPEAMPA